MKIIAHKKTLKTAKKLGKALGCEVTTKPCNHGFNIRWGSRVKDAGPYDLNNSYGMDKAEQRKVLLGYGVEAPKLFDPNADRLPYYAIVVGRPRRHSKGREFYMCYNMEDVEKAMIDGCEYFSFWFNKTHEYRVHCAGGKILLIQDKLLKGDRGTFDGTPWVTVPRKEWRRSVCLNALASVDYLDLDFGAVDVMYNESSDSVCVCEVNTAPSLSGDYVFGKYIKYFKMAERVGNRKWDWRRFVAVDSLAWKEKQFESGPPVWGIDEIKEDGDDQEGEF